MRSHLTTASEFNPENTAESKDQNASLVAENQALTLQNEKLISENKALRDRIKKLEEKNYELLLNLELQRQLNPNLNKSGFFSFNFPPKPAELLSEELSLDCIRDELLPWICEEVGKLEEIVKIIRSEFKPHLEAHEANKIILTGKIYHKEKVCIVPTLINSNGEQTESYFTRETCIKINDHLFTHFQLKNKLGRITDDHKNYHAWITKKVSFELNEYRKKSSNNTNEKTTLNSDQSNDSKNENPDQTHLNTMKM